MRGILESLFGPSAGSVDRSPWTSDFYFRPVVAPTHAGIDVSEDIALTYSTVYACVSKIAKTIATLPVHVYKRLPDGGKEPAPDHPLQALWQMAPNHEMSAVSAREAFLTNTLLWGNGILEIQETHSDGVGYLWPLLTRHLTLKRDDNDVLYFEYSLPGEEMRVLRFDQVVNLAAFSTDGIVGRTPIQMARESVGLGLAARQFQSSFLKNGASASMVLKHPGTEGPLSEGAAIRLLASFNEHHQGSVNAGKPILLEEGTEVQLIGMSFKDAQYLELGHALKEDICGMYDVPLTMIQDDKRATYSNNEQKAIDWVVGCILPWCVRIETAMNNSLLDGGREYYLKHELDGLMRGDMETRWDSYTKMIRVGVPINVFLKLEDMNGIGSAGDRSFVSADLVPLDKIDEVIESKRPATGSPPSEPKEPGDREDARALAADVAHTKKSVDLLHEGAAVDEARHNEVMEAVGREDARAMDVNGVFRPLLIDAAQRIVNKEVKAIGNAWKRHAKNGTTDTFLKSVEKFYSEQEDAARETVLVVLQGWSLLSGNSDLLAAGLARLFASQYAAVGLAAVRDCVSEAPERLPEELSKWQESKAEELAEGLLAKITDRE